MNPKIMAEAEAGSFFHQHSSESWFQELCCSMAERGETTALCVSKSKGVASLLSLVGPADPKEVRVACVPCKNQPTFGVLFQRFSEQ